MTDTDEREATAASSPSGPDANDARTEDPRAAHLAGQRAFKELTAPIRGSMMVARVLGFLYGALAVAPLRRPRPARRGASCRSALGGLT